MFPSIFSLRKMLLGSPFLKKLLSITIPRISWLFVRIKPITYLFTKENGHMKPVDMLTGANVLSANYMMTLFNYPSANKVKLITQNAGDFIGQMVNNNGGIMKIQHLSIKNFLRIETIGMDLSVAPVHIIVGENESGKSSIRDSLQWCLTGSARGLKTHDQAAAFIHEGAKAAEVTITWGDKTCTTRKKTPKVAATRTGPVPDDQVMAAILSDPLFFLSLEDKARREVLFRLLPGLSPTGEEISNRLLNVASPGHEKTAAISQIEFQAIDDIGNLAATKGFKEAETEAIVKRRIAKRTRDDAQVQEPETKTTIGGVLRILPDIQAADVEAGLSALRIERDKLQQKRGKVEAQADKLPELEQALANLEADPPDAPDPDRPVEGFVKALKINQGILEKCRAKVAAMTAGSPGTLFPEDCPYASVPCPSFGEVAIESTKPKDVKPEALAKAQADLAEQEKEVGLIEEDLKAARTAREVYDSYTQTHQDLVGKIAKLKESQAQAQDTAAIDEQITALDQRMKTGYELLDAVREFWRKKEAAEAAAEKVAQAEKEIALYDALAKALAPTGIPSELIREALGPVNEKLAMASGYLFPDIDEHAPVHLTEDLEVYRGTTPYSLLSKSARYRAGIAFQVTLAQLAKARIMMVDECDILDGPNRAALLDFIVAVQEDFDTVILLATSDHASPSPNPDLKVWVIIDGQVQPLNPGFIFHDGEVIRDEELKAA